MKAIFIYTKWLTFVGTILLTCMVGLHGSSGFFSQGESSVTHECNLQSQNDGNEDDRHIVKLHISPNKFNGTDQSGKSESLSQPFCSPLYAYKLIRSTLFDAEQSLVLSQKLIWYTQLTYLLRLSPFWQPSIPIAHRKLII